MGYSVYWANGRWQGYGVPSYCDHPGCFEKIDRGMGYAPVGYETVPEKFFCIIHQYEDPDSIEIDLEKEHPEWLNHVLTDETWKQWRDEEPEIVKRYKEML